MSTRAASGEATTYLLEGRQLAEVVDFVAELARRGVTLPEPKPALVRADGRRLEVPEPVFEALVQVATAMAHGQGVTVIPQNALLTTQEAAELLGISRPTLVRLLEEGGIPFEQRGRHRRVMLADLLAYQGSMRRERRDALDRMAQEGQAAGLYEATSGPAVQARLSSLMARFPAFLDTCTLYGAYLCDSLLRLAEAGTYRPLWSADVLVGLERALVARGLTEDAVKYRIGEMRRAFPDAEVRSSPTRPWRSCSTSTRRSRHGTCPRGRPTRDSSAAPSSPPWVHLEVRKVRGPILDQPYARLKRCGGERGRGSTGDLGPCRPGPNAGGIAPRQRYREGCSCKGARSADRVPAPGNGRRERTGGRRTEGNRRTASEGDEPGGQKGNRRKARRGPRRP